MLVTKKTKDEISKTKLPFNERPPKTLVTEPNYIPITDIQLKEHYMQTN